MRLPEHLELMVSDEPVVDNFAFGPWRMSDAFIEQVRDRVHELVSDPRFAGLTTKKHDALATPAPLVVPDLMLTIDFLRGGAALYTGSHAQVQRWFLRRYYKNPPQMLLDRTTWGANAGHFMPLDWLRDVEDQSLALVLGREALDVFEGFEPFETRRKALIRLFDDPPAGLDRSTPMKTQQTAWVAKADDEVLAALPELTGPIGYLEWVCAGLLPVHEHLLEAAPRDEPVLDLLAHLVLQADIAQPPAELSVVLGPDRYGELLERHAAVKDFDGSRWSNELRSWLARCMGAGEIDACRAWLDMTVRFTGVIMGLPDATKSPETWVPVSGFLEDVRRLFAPRRRVVNPLAGKLRAQGPQGRTARATRRGDLDYGLIGQPNVVAALEEIAKGSGPVRLLLAGPDGTGKRDAAQQVARLLGFRGISEEPAWLSDSFYAGDSARNNTTSLYQDAMKANGTKLMVIDGLDNLSRDPRSGAAMLEELHRAVDVFGDLHVVALCEPGGDLLIREVNPGLALRLKTVHTRPFTAEGYAELFDRALHQRGARAHKRALAAAGELLSRTRPVRNLRNARLAHRLADVVLEAVREETPPGGELVVKRAAIPATFDVAGTPGDPMAELAAMTGLTSVKQEVELLVAGAKAARLRRESGMPVPAPSRHLVFTGNPGTGKTAVARLIARIYKDLGVLSSGHLVEASRPELIGEYLGETAIKTRAVVKSAIGGVLFIDEAYSLTNNGYDGDYGPEAIAELVKMMEDHRDDLVVIVAGYEREMGRFIASNPGLASRFPTTVRFPDYTDDELVALFAAMAAQAGLEPTDSARNRVRDLLRRAPRGRSFGNVRLIRTLCERATALQARRVFAQQKKATPDELVELLAEDLPASLGGSTREVSHGDPIAELEALIGLGTIKEEVRRLVAEARSAELRRAAGRPLDLPTRHMIFTGNPGTAKTTVARLIARVYAQLGLLSSGHLVEVGRADLVGAWLGQTAPKVQAAVEQALGGVLFIDEAYALTSEDDAYGSEAVATLVKLIEEYRGDLLVIAAGSEQEMTSFLAANSGLESRFPKHLRFPDYTDPELTAIFEHLAAAEGLSLAPGLLPGLRALLGRIGRGPSFGNGRLTRNLLDATIANQAQRLTATDSPADVLTLTPEDLPSATFFDEPDHPGLYL